MAEGDGLRGEVAASHARMVGPRPDHLVSEKQARRHLDDQQFIGAEGRDIASPGRRLAEILQPCA